MQPVAASRTITIACGFRPDHPALRSQIIPQTVCSQIVKIPDVQRVERSCKNRRSHICAIIGPNVSETEINTLIKEIEYIANEYGYEAMTIRPSQAGEEEDF